MRKLNRLKPVILFLVVLVSLFGVYQASIVRKVECKNISGECTAFERDLLSSRIGKSVFLINKKSMEADFKKDPRISKVDFRYKAGVLLNAVVTYNDEFLDLRVVPQTSFGNATGSAILWSKVLSMVNHESTQASHFRLWKSGFLTSIQDEHFEAVLFADKMPDKQDIESMYTQIEHIKNNYADRAIFIQDKTAVVVIDQLTYLVFDIKQDPVQVFATLQQITAVTTMDTRKRLIDLRFNKPVISLN